MFRVVRALALLSAVALVACGGGSSGSSAPDLGSFSAKLDESPAEATAVEGTPETLGLVSSITYRSGPNGPNAIIVVDTDRSVVSSVQGRVTSGSPFIADSLSMSVNFRGDLAPGDYTTDVVVHACLNTLCTLEPRGSPVRFPVRYHVKPNIQVPPLVLLSRQGAEPAPQTVVPVNIPPEAGSVTMTSESISSNALSVAFDNNALHIETQQVHAGIYAAVVTLRSTADSRYLRTINVRYTVAEPPGGERPMSVQNPSSSISLRQGEQSVQHIVVTRPTWTNDWNAPEIMNDSNHMLTLSDRGDGHYDVAIQTTGLPAGSYSPWIRFSAEPSGGVASAAFNIAVGLPFHVDGNLTPQLRFTSTTADLEWVNPVVMSDGSSVRWTAVSESPLLHVVNGSGLTGVDPLRLRLDPAALTQPDWTLALPVEVSVDRPGTLTQTIPFGVSNIIPTVQIASPVALVGGSGRVYVQGAFRSFNDPISSNRLHIDGATLSNARMVSDTRYIGDWLVMALDLTGATPGQPVTIRVDDVLTPTQVQLQVQSPLRSNIAYQALAYGTYRPGEFAPGLTSLYFSGPDTVYRWASASGVWTMSQSTVSDLIDVAIGADEQHVYAINASQVMSLDPVTLTQNAVGTLNEPQMAFDKFAARGLRGLVMTPDGRALASILWGGEPTAHNVGTICSTQVRRTVPELTEAPASCDPGSGKGMVYGSTGSGLVKSINGYVVAGTGPNGRQSIYRADVRAWAPTAPYPSGVWATAISDSGSRVVRSDGAVVDDNGTSVGNLAAVVPFTDTPAGYGLSSSGRFGLVYGYRTSGTGSSRRAAAATLWVVDLGNIFSGISSSSVVATIALPDAVGCTSAFATGETCEHLASISVAPGDGTAFVLGPRGVAAVPLPSSVSTLQASTEDRKSITGVSKLPQAPSTIRSPIRGVLAPR